MRDHGTGGGVNPDIPHPVSEDPLERSPWEKGPDGIERCKWCGMRFGSEHLNDCPWHVWLMSAKDNPPATSTARLGNRPKPSIERGKLWVVGTDSGIGAHTAKMAEGVGWDVVATNRIQCDVRIAKDVEWTVREIGPFDAVLYCAGVNYLDWSADIKDDDLLNTFEVNVMGFIRVIRALAQSQLESACSIVAVVSAGSTRPMRTSMAYCASKAALAMAVRVAAREHAPYWRVNGISPAAVEGTEMSRQVDERVPELRGWTSVQAADYERSQNPLGRRILMGEVASLALDILAGPESLNGAIIELTGGM